MARARSPKKRSAILLAAVEEIAKAGLGAATAKIAKRAGVASGMFDEFAGMSVVDGQLKVFGIDNLRIADASIMPRVTTGNTMAPCVIIGERDGEILKMAHGMS
jgi:choline dehydrogenase-like flavoprotein